MNALIIVGLKHSGKSSIGLGLAKYFDLPFYDTDTIIQNKSGYTCRNLYLEKGEHAFKKTELEACEYIESALYELPNTKFPSLIVSTGGGICDNPKAISILQGIGKILLLNVEESICFERIYKNMLTSGSYPAYISKENPKTDSEAQEIFHKFYTKRLQIYKSICNNEFFSDGTLSKEDNLSRCIELLKTFPHQE